MVIFDDRVREEIAAKFMQSRLDVAPGTFHIDLEIFAHADRENFRHPKVLHRISDCYALRIQNRCFRCYDHLHLHPLNINARGHPTS